MRSASYSTRVRGTAGVAAILGAGLLAGCASTQQKAARLRLNSARILASQNPTRVAAPGHLVAVSGISLVPGGRETAIVVTVRNRGGSAVSDLPISVGYRAGRRRPIYLNAAADIAYFRAHLPAVPAHGTLAWVYTTTRRRPPGAHPFAVVGAAPAVPGSGVGLLPSIRAGIRTGGGRDVVAVAVRNLSGVPQYQLPVYAIAERDGRAVAAGEGTLSLLDGNSGQTVHVRLLGRADQAQVRVQAPPTIFH